MAGKKTRVMVVDDSALMRKLIANLLEKDPEIQVIATAIDGLFALSKIEQGRPTPVVAGPVTAASRWS